MKPHESHRRASPTTLRVRIVTVSSSRHAAKESGKEYSDEGGDIAEAETRRGGHTVSLRRLVSDDFEMIRGEMKDFISGGDDVIIFTGGTGVSSRDITIETVRPYFDKELDGFGELLRRISFEEVGSAAVLTRATAGIVRGRVVLCLPGSPRAVKTALRAFIGELAHAIYVARA